MRVREQVSEGVQKSVRKIQKRGGERRGNVRKIEVSE